MKANRDGMFRRGPAGEIEISGGRRIRLAWFDDSHRDALLQFYRALPKDTRLYLKDDVTNQTIIDQFIERMHSGNALMITAWHEDAIVGETTQHFVHHGWTRHVSELRPVVHEQYAGLGILGALIHEQVEVASEMGLDKVVVRLLQFQKDKRRIYESLGFIREAVLRDHATDAQGKRHNMLIMSIHVSDLWRKMEDLIRETDMHFDPCGEQ